MSKNHKQQTFKRYQSMRLANYDYRATAAYAITICALNRYLEILKVPRFNAIITEEWQHLPQRFASITLDTLLIIMPDHLHCIIWNNEQTENVKSIIDIIGTYKSLVVRAWW